MIGVSIGLFLSEDGLFAALGDTGNWSYSRFSCNSIRHFVAYNLTGESYLMDKLTAGKRTDFNSKQTRKWIKRDILEQRRLANIDAERARDAWRDLPDEYGNSRDFEDYLCDYRDIFTDDWYSLLAYDHDSMVKSFCENSLPGLQELIKKELEAEASLKEIAVL